MNGLFAAGRRTFASKALMPARRILPEEEAHAHHAQSGEGLWYKISLFVAIPSLIGATVYVYGKEAEHLGHLDHHHPEYVPWPHLRIRKVEFPWGNESAFRHPVYNPSPDDQK